MAVKEWLGTTDGDYQLDANWLPAAAPIAGDDVYLKSGANPIDTNLDNSGVLLSSFHIEVGYTGLIGTDVAFLQIQTPLLYIGTNPTSSNLNGSQRINMDVGSVTACDIAVERSNPGSADIGRTPVRLRGTNAGSRLFVQGGSVSLSDDPSDSSTMVLVDTSGGSLTIGENVTLTDVTTRERGECLLQSTLSGTLEILGGALETALAIAVPAVNVKGGQFTPNSSGLISTMIITGGLVDFGQSNVPRTVTDCTMSSNAEMLIDPDLITFTNDLVLGTGKPLRISTSEQA